MKRRTIVKIDNRIRQCREDAGGLSQHDLADAVGVSRQTINAIETGKYAPSLETALLIAHALKRPLDQVFVCVFNKG